MSGRDLSLHPRVEDTRDKKVIEPVIQFPLVEIRERFDKTILDIENQFDLAALLIEEEKVDSAKEIYRSQIVFLESALDFYIHEISKYGVISIFTKRWSKTEKYNNFKIPMSVFETGIRNPESTSWLAEYLNSRFSVEVYLSSESMKDQLNMLGLCFHSIMETAFPIPSNPDEPYKEGKIIVKELFERRNQIAHQSDRKHATAERNDISKEYVQKCISDVKKLVEAIHNAALNRTP